MDSPEDDVTRTKTESPEEASIDAEADPSAETALAGGGDARGVGTASPGGGRAAVSEDGEEDRSGEMLGRFRLSKKIGQGGMGVVYAAEDRKLGRTVALKILSREAVQREDRRRRFLREARAAAAVLHPSIATIFEVGEEGGEVFLAMEHVAGETLRKVMREAAGPMPLARALTIARDIATGLGKAHGAGIVHRDLKPENVMITPEGHVKILDFGLAKRVSGGEAAAPAGTGDLATIEGQILGTVGYMAPEQALGEAVDPRTDLFSLGVILYEMVAGVRPFVGETRMGTLIATHRDPAAAPSARNPGVPKDVDALVLRCLEKAKEARYQSAGELAEALEAALIGAREASKAVRGAESKAVRGAESKAVRGAESKGGGRRARGIVIAGGIAAVAMVAVGVWGSRGSGAPGAVPRRPCLAEDAGKNACSGTDKGAAGEIAWCDAEGRALGCCGEGLVPKGADGICVCAPGGSAVPEARSRGCSAVAADHDELYSKAKGEAMTRAIACFEPDRFRSSIAGGTFEAEFYLTPEGEVFGARVHRTTTPDDEGQACAVAALRSIRFPPPPWEEAGKKQGFGFVFKD